jgi:hypothetical protein
MVHGSPALIAALFLARVEAAGTLSQQLVGRRRYKSTTHASVSTASTERACVPKEVGYDTLLRKTCISRVIQTATEFSWGFGHQF